MEERLPFTACTGNIPRWRIQGVLCCERGGREKEKRDHYKWVINSSAQITQCPYREVARWSCLQP